MLLRLFQRRPQVAVWRRLFTLAKEIVLIRLKLKIELLSSPFSIFQKTPKKTGCYYLHSSFFRRLQTRPVLIISIFISSEDFLDIRGRYQNALTLHNLLKAQSTMVVHNLLLEKLDIYQYDPCHS